MAFECKTNEQRTALTRVAQWMKDPSRQVFYLGGYAGTGKTELARHFAQGVNGSVCFGAYTGKAALVLIQRGCYNARTIHSWLYSYSGHGSQRLQELTKALAGVREQEDAAPGDVEALEEEIAKEQAKVDQPNWRVNEETELRGAALVVLDECSMIDKRVAGDLLAVCKKILVLGDPAQLPPVKGTGYFTNREPDYLLTTVVRHDNGILDIATKVREGNINLPFGHINQDVAKFSKRGLPIEEFAKASQLLTGRNDARLKLNAGLRRVHGRQGNYPVAGDRVICLKNNREHALVNGQIETVAADARELEADCTVFPLEGHVVPNPDCPPEPDAGPTPLSVYTGHFRKYWQADVRLLNYYDRMEYDEFDYGYAITVHKSQGSQWSHPWLCDDNFLHWRPSDRRKWLYTAITRAVDKLTIVA